MMQSSGVTGRHAIRPVDVSPRPSGVAGGLLPATAGGRILPRQIPPARRHTDGMRTHPVSSLADGTDGTDGILGSLGERCLA